MPVAGRAKVQRLFRMVPLLDSSAIVNPEF
jgi:hypothetical protein